MIIKPLFEVFCESCIQLIFMRFTPNNIRIVHITRIRCTIRSIEEMEQRI